MNFGMTQLLIHSAPVAFLPPTIELSAMVRVNSLASALRVVSLLALLPRQPAVLAVRTTRAARAIARRTRPGHRCIRAPLVREGGLGGSPTPTCRMAGCPC